MRYRILGGVAAAALGLAAMGAWALPASAQVARFQPALANGADSGDLLTLVRERGERGGGGGGRGGDGGGGGGGGGRAERGGGDNIRQGAGADRSGDARATRGDSARVSRAAAADHRRRHHRRHWKHRHRDSDRFSGRMVFGLGFSPSYAYAPGYYVSDAAVASCMRRFPSYDPAWRAYLGADGQWHPCP